MLRQLWTLTAGRPVIQLEMTLTSGLGTIRRQLLADTGAGSMGSSFELIIPDSDCRVCAHTCYRHVSLGGAYSGRSPAYLVRVQLAALQFDADVLVVGVPQAPQYVDGIACFRFLNRFTYGNFGDAARFGLEA